MAANASKVTEQLLIGGDLDYWDNEVAHQQLAELARAGVTHIVDARVEASSQVFVAKFAPQVVYLHHGMDDAGQKVPVTGTVALIDRVGRDTVS